MDDSQDNVDKIQLNDTNSVYSVTVNGLDTITLGDRKYRINNDYYLTFVKNTKDCWRFKCKKSSSMKCKSILEIYENKDFKIIGDHNHEPEKKQTKEKNKNVIK